MSTSAQRIVARYLAADSPMKGWPIQDRFDAVLRAFHREVAEAIIDVLPAHLKSEGVDRGYGEEETGWHLIAKGATLADVNCTIEVEIGGSEFSPTVAWLQYRDDTGRKAETRFKFREGEVKEANQWVTRWASGF